MAAGAGNLRQRVRRPPDLCASQALGVAPQAGLSRTCLTPICEYARILLLSPFPAMCSLFLDRDTPRTRIGRLRSAGYALVVGILVKVSQDIRVAGLQAVLPTYCGAPRAGSAQADSNGNIVQTR